MKFRQILEDIHPTLGLAHEVATAHGYKNTYGHGVYRHEEPDKVDHKQLHQDLQGIGFTPEKGTTRGYTHEDGSYIGGYGDKGTTRNTKAPYEMIIGRVNV